MDASEIEPEKWYSASVASTLMGIREATVKKKLREKKIVGKQIGTKKVWHVKGEAILKFRVDWNLEDVG